MNAGTSESRHHPPAVFYHDRWTVKETRFARWPDALRVQTQQGRRAVIFLSVRGDDRPRKQDSVSVLLPAGNEWPHLLIYNECKNTQRQRWKVKDMEFKSYFEQFASYFLVAVRDIACLQRVYRESGSNNFCLLLSSTTYLQLRMATHADYIYRGHYWFIHI